MPLTDSELAAIGRRTGLPLSEDGTGKAPARHYGDL